MNYEYHFKDSKDIEECKEYLHNTFGFNPFALMMEGNRFFEITMNKNDFDRIYMSVVNDKRTADVSHTKRYDFEAVTKSFYKFDNFEKYTIRARILPNEKEVNENA